MNNKTIEFYVPQSFGTISLGIHEKYRDDIAYICHLLTTAKFFDKRYRDGDWVPLYSPYLQSIIRASYSKVLNTAIQCGIIYQYRAYRYTQPGIKGFSRRYILTEKLNSEKWIKYIPTNKRLIRNYIKWKHKELDDKEKSNVHQHLINCLHKITIDDVPEDVINNIVNKGIKKSDSKKRKEIKKELRKDILLASINNIKEQNIKWTPDEYGRIHTNITNLNKKIKKYIKLNNQTITNTDITNSQPIFLTTIISNKLQFKTINNHKLVDYPEDFINFVNLCESGKLYAFIRLHSKCSFRRKRIKQRCFSLFYGRNLYDNPIISVFKKHFPTVWNSIRKIKQIHGYKFLAQEMQRRESNFVIEKCCHRLMLEYPHIDILTIHDSIVSLTEYSNIVKKIMIEEFNKIGLNPKLKTEQWN